MEITYTDSLKNISHKQLNGFFVGWPNHPNSKKHLEILQNSYKIWLAFEGEKCVGFINAISDGVYYSFIPLLEVLPDFKGQGIGSELVKKMLESLKGMYAIDVVCDESVVPFYEKHNLAKCVGMVKRNYENQS
ncbi:MAG: GNAT family N-acetyltransferase [Calditrichaeota bacterium]|nr:MAG: GNAT family N-acetyltransferase [Calditrichota bacterium]